MFNATPIGKAPNDRNIFVSECNHKSTTFIFIVAIKYEDFYFHFISFDYNFNLWIASNQIFGHHIFSVLPFETVHAYQLHSHIN